MIADTEADRHVFSDRQQHVSYCSLVHHFSISDTIPKSNNPLQLFKPAASKNKISGSRRYEDKNHIKKTSTWPAVRWTVRDMLILRVHVKSDVCWTVHHCDTWRIKNQLDGTYYFTVLLIGSTCFGHYYAHHQELATIMLITTLVISFLVCCMMEVRCG